MYLSIHTPQYIHAPRDLALPAERQPRCGWRGARGLKLYIYIYIYVYRYIYTYIHIYIYVSIYTHTSVNTRTSGPRAACGASAEVRVEGRAGLAVDARREMLRRASSGSVGALGGGGTSSCAGRSATRIV